MQNKEAVKPSKWSFGIFALAQVLEKNYHLNSDSSIDQLADAIRDHLLKTPEGTKYLQDKTEVLKNSNRNVKGPLKGHVPYYTVPSKFKGTDFEKLMDMAYRGVYRAIGMHWKAETFNQDQDIIFPGLGKVKVTPDDRYHPDVLSGRIVDDSTEGRSEEALEYVMNLGFHQADITTRSEFIASQMYEHSEKLLVSEYTLDALREFLQSVKVGLEVDGTSRESLSKLIRKLKASTIHFEVYDLITQAIADEYIVQDLIDTWTLSNDLQAVLCRASEHAVCVTFKSAGIWSELTHDQILQKMEFAERLQNELTSGDSSFVDTTRIYSDPAGTELFRAKPVMPTKSNDFSHAQYLPWKKHGRTTAAAEVSAFLKQELAHGKKVVVLTGHRPKDIIDPTGQLQLEDKSAFQKAYWSEIWLPALIRCNKVYLEAEKPDYVVTGMADGQDQAGALAALSLGIPLICVVPFAGQEKKWSKAVQKRFHSILDRAFKAVVLVEEFSEEDIPKLLNFRNLWMLEHGNNVLALYMGDDITGERRSGTKNCISAAKSKKLRTRNMWSSWMKNSGLYSSKE